jgi:hypothetical protein
VASHFADGDKPSKVQVSEHFISPAFPFPTDASSKTSPNNILYNITAPHSEKFPFSLEYN